MSHTRKYAIALVGADSSLTGLYATRLSLAEAAAWLDSHRRAPSPDGQPCILLHPISPSIRLAIAKRWAEGPSRSG
jgi:hypothetical protein